MIDCIDEGHLRAYLDGELPEFERAAVAYHITGCSRCRTKFQAVRGAAQQASALLAPPELPDAYAAFANFRAAQTATSAPVRADQEGTPVNRMNRVASGTRRTAITAVAVLAVFIGLLALPPVRAAADSLLKVFRVQQVVFVPVNSDRIRKLNELNFDKKTLFLAEPKVEGEKEPRAVASAAEQQAQVGFPVGQPSQLPSPAESTSYYAHGAQTATFQVNVKSARELLNLLDVKDVTLPDSLGTTPITVKVQPFAQTEIKGSNYTLTLLEGRSPEVTLPDGVDLPQLGTVMLRVLGTEPSQAEAMAKSIDWSTTLVVPIPSNVRNVQKVTVNGVDGMLVGTGGRDLPENAPRGSVLYWKSGEQFHVLRASGNISTAELVQIAESVR